MKQLMNWYNYRTEEHETIETPEDFSDYVPQIGGLGMYNIYVMQGTAPIDAALKVLKIACGVAEESYKEVKNV